MRADEYVVEQLLKAQHELAELKAANIYLREENKDLEEKYNLIKSFFKVEETSSGYGYQIVCYDADNYKHLITMTLNKEPEKIEPAFMELLNALDLVLPVDNNIDGLVNDPTLVELALEKVKELENGKEESDD